MFKRILVLCLVVSFVYTQKPISGQVFSSSGNPLSYAVISDISGQTWTISDEVGIFYYSTSSKQNSGDSLIVSRYGYDTRYVQISDNPFYIIELIPQPIIHKSIYVEGLDNKFSKQLSNTYNHLLSNKEPINLLQQIPGMAIRSYGGKTGGMFLSTFGGPAVNTKLLLGDVDLTNSQFGSIDLTLIPEPLINNMTMVNSPSILFGSGAVDGAIKINPWQNTSYLSARIGSFGHEGILGNYYKNFERFVVNFSIGTTKDEGNYNYQFEKEELSRENNDFDRTFISFNTAIKVNEKSNIYGLYMESHQKRGVTGSIAWPSPLARRENKLQLGNISYNHLNKKGYTRIQLSTQISKENFDDPNPFWPVSSEHTVTGNTIILNHNQTIWNNIGLNLLIEGKQEVIESTDVGNHERFNQSFATEVKIPFLNNFRFHPAFRVDKIGDSDLHPTQSIGVAYYGLKNSEFEYIIRTGFRNPTFNDLYWNPGGNPDLKPESSWIQSLKSKIYLGENRNSNVYINISDNHATDLIQWAPIDETFLVWQPQNIAKSHRTNFTIGNQSTFKKIPLQFAIHATYLKSEDLDLNKPLLNTPELIGFIGVDYTFSALNIGLQAHYTGERISQYGFDEDTYLKEYWYTTATIMYNTAILGNTISVGLDVSNIFDKQYMVISDYPEPGRMLNLQLKYLFN